MQHIIPKQIHFQQSKDKDKQVPIQFASSDNLELVGAKGWCSALVNFPIIEGAYYCEISVLPPKEPLPFGGANAAVAPHVRIGVAAHQSNIISNFSKSSNCNGNRAEDGNYVAGSDNINNNNNNINNNNDDDVILLRGNTGCVNTNISAPINYEMPLGS